jgi:hypothetical protein
MSRKNVDIDILGKGERGRKKEGRRLATAESKTQKGRYVDRQTDRQIDREIDI